MGVRGKTRTGFMVTTLIRATTVQRCSKKLRSPRQNSCLVAAVPAQGLQRTDGSAVSNTFHPNPLSHCIYSILSYTNRPCERSGADTEPGSPCRGPVGAEQLAPIPGGFWSACLGSGFIFRKSGGNPAWDWNLWGFLLFCSRYPN